MLSINRRLRLLAILSLLTLVTSCSSCGADLSPDFGVFSLKIDTDREVYFKREVAGQNYDLLVLSPNRDHCTPPNPQSDYIFHGGPRKIYYKIEDGVLVLFVSIAATPPEGPGFPVSVRQNEIHPLDFADFQKNYQNQGLKLLEVEINRNLRCN